MERRVGEESADERPVALKEQRARSLTSSGSYDITDASMTPYKAKFLRQWKNKSTERIARQEIMDHRASQRSRAGSLCLQMVCVRRSVSVFLQANWPRSQTRCVRYLHPGL